MKKFECLMLVAAFMLMLASSCGNKGQVVQYATYDENSFDNPNRDTTMYGICANGSAMNTLQMLTDAGDSVSLSTERAQEAGQVFGGYAVGDRMAVLVNRDTTEATMVINMSMLLGDWVMPNPLDGSDEVGISIKEGGIAESIKQSSIFYKTWRIFNGRLEIDAERESGLDISEHQSCKLLYLSADSLAYKDMIDDGDVFEYGRQRIVKQKEVIKLEESNFDDFLW
jgi:hypothetical protein